MAGPIGFAIGMWRCFSRPRPILAKAVLLEDGLSFLLSEAGAFLVQE